MKTAKEWLVEQLKEFPNHDEYDPKAVDAIADFMEHYAKYYHQQQVKSVDLANVGGALPNYSDDVNTESAINMGRTLDIGKQ